MRMFDIILSIVSAICTVISVIGAYKSIKYYKKSKQLTIYANTNVSLVEVQKIISTFTEILKIANPSRSQRGVNLSKQLAAYGESIRDSINVIRDKLSVEDYELIKYKLSSKELRVDAYIYSFISGAILEDGCLKIDDRFNRCQQKFYDIQQTLKRRLEEVEAKLS